MTTKVEHFVARGWKHDGFPLVAKPNSEYRPSKIERVEWKTLAINKAGQCVAVETDKPPSSASRSFSKSHHLWTTGQLVGKAESVGHITYVSDLYFTSPDPGYLWRFDVFHSESNIWELEKAEPIFRATASWRHETVSLEKDQWHPLEKALGDSESEEESERKSGTYQYLGLEDGIPTLLTQTYYFDELKDEKYEPLELTEVQWLMNSRFALGKRQGSDFLFMPGRAVSWPIIDGVAGYYQTAPESILIMMKDGAVHLVTFGESSHRAQQILPPLGFELARGNDAALYYEPKSHVLTQLSSSDDSVVFVPECLRDLQMLPPVDPNP